MSLTPIALAPVAGTTENVETHTIAKDLLRPLSAAYDLTDTGATRVFEYTVGFSAGVQSFASAPASPAYFELTPPGGARMGQWIKHTGYTTSAFTTVTTEKVLVIARDALGGHDVPIATLNAGAAFFLPQDSNQGAVVFRLSSLGTGTVAIEHFSWS
jgi:hypothetical protein